MTDKNNNGCFQIYTGNGKGKTTALLGLILRATGAGMRVYLGQFLKGRDCAELHALKNLSPALTIERFGSGNWAKKGDPDDISLARAGLEKVKAALCCGNYDLIAIDEIFGTLNMQLLETSEVCELIKTWQQAPNRPELVMTGRNAPEIITGYADLVTEMREVKHYYKAGIPARKGIEF